MVQPFTVFRGTEVKYKPYPAQHLIKGAQEWAIVWHSRDERCAAGMFRGTNGEFSGAPKGDELIMPYQGRRIYKSATRESIECGPGDLIYIPAGTHVATEYLEDCADLFVVMTDKLPERYSKST